MPTVHVLIAVLVLAAASAFFVACDGDDDDNDDVGNGNPDDDADDDADADDDIGDDDTWQPLDDDVDDDADEDDGAWRFIRDEMGRALIFRGCNFDGSAKGDSGLPVFDESYPEAMAGTWGFNFARYLFMWSKIEPEPGVYDEDYLDAVEERLDWLADNDIQTVLDAHQDIWGVDFHSGSNGAPHWATITDGLPHIKFSEYLGAWAADYLSPAVMRAFTNFWDYETHPELQDHFAAMWTHIAERFKDHPAVLGYDFLNEPWQGENLVRFADFDREEYSDFLQRMIEAVRSVDSENWIFYEPNALATNQGMPNWLRVLDDPRDGPDRLVFFPHLYPVWIDISGGYDPDWDRTLVRWEQYRKADAARQKAPVISGEWAMLSWLDRENLDLWTGEALATLERATSGWAYWDCRWFFEGHDDEYRADIAAVYPRAVAGTPVSYHYDLASRVFTLKFKNFDGASGLTEIYIPEEREYPDGWTVTSTDPDDAWSWEWDAGARVLAVEHDPDRPFHIVTVAPI